nr:resistance to Congo red protein [Bacillus gaemokensis]
MIDFLVFLFIFVAGFMILQILTYRFAKKNVYKYKGIKPIYPALTGSNTPTSKFSESKEVRWEINCP